MAKQKNNKQLMASRQSYECPQSFEPIANPLCHNCLGKEIESWLSSYPKVKKKINPIIKKYIQDINNLTNEALECVSCKKKRAALCPYCFTEGVFNILKREDTDRRILSDFLKFFNFDLDHTGYAKDAEQQGLY